MPLKEYKPGTAFSGVIGRTFDVSSPAWPEPLRAKEGAPNVLFIVQDDTGFGQLGCYGSPIATPNIDQLAANGLLFNNMHTTAHQHWFRSAGEVVILEALKVSNTMEYRPRYPIKTRIAARTRPVCG